MTLCEAKQTLLARRLARLDTELPDALPDDLVGVQELAARGAQPRARGGVK